MTVELLLGRESQPYLTTRAVTVRVAADGVWPWIAQLGQARGGFYSYDVLENLVGCDIHSAERVVPDWRPSSSATRSTSIPRSA